MNPAMAVLARILIVVALIASAERAVVATRYNSAYREGVRASREYRQFDAWEAFNRARDLRSSGCEIWTWAGDSALALGQSAFWLSDMTLTGEAMTRAWRDYAGAVLRCPRDSWSWSGLAAVSILRARSKDRGAGLDLDVLSGRASGILDADRAIALAAGEIAVSLNPTGYVELDVLAEIHEANGDFDAAHELFVDSARGMPAPSFHSWGGGRTLAKPLYHAVLEGLEAGLESAPKNEHSLLSYQIGKFAFAQGDGETALRYLDQALALAATAYEIYQASWEMAAVLQSAGNLAAAREALLRAKQTQYAPDLVSRRLGQVSFALDEFDRACVELRSALRGSPADTGLRLQTSRACESAGEIDLAERLLRDGFVLPSDNPTIARALLEHLRRAGKRYSAAHLARSWAQDDPERVEFQQWASEFEIGGF